MKSVIVLDQLAPEGLQLLEAAKAQGVSYEERVGLKGEDLRQALMQYDGAVCRSGVQITPEILEGNTRLKAIVRAGVGTDNINKDAATQLGIVVMNTPDGNTISTAEHAFTLMAALSRNVAPAYHSLLNGKWDKKSNQGTQLAGKTLGIVGLGRIGVEFAKRAKAFQMRVLAIDPYLSTARAEELGVERYEALDEVLGELDYLTVHTPLTPETTNLINDAAIEKIKPGARLINCARGGIYNEESLAKGLQSGKLGGVALDVFASEPCTDSPLFGMKNVLCTPHLGASTEEAQTQVSVEAVELVLKYLTTGEIRNAVNTSSLAPETLAELRGYLNVAYRLGVLLGQWHGGAPSQCTLSFRGEVSQKDTRLLTSSFCAGLLEHMLDSPANIVNAEVLLKARGVNIAIESRSESQAFSSTIEATLEGDGRSMTAAGTLFGSGMPRLVRLNDYQLEAYLDGKLLIFTHNDVPGIIGSVGATCGRHNVNIAQMSVGRCDDTPGGAAVGVLNVDQAPTQDVLDEITQHEAINSASVVHLPPRGELPAWLR